MRKFTVIILFISQLANAQQWREMSFFELNGCFVRSTSELSDKTQPQEYGKDKYGAHSAVDGNYQTAWVEGVPDYGIGESIFVSIPSSCSTINIQGGYGKSEILFHQNSRPKTLRLKFHVGINPTGYVSEISSIFLTQQYCNEYIIQLVDIDSLQSFAFPFQKGQVSSFSDSVKERYFEQYTEQIFQMVNFVEIEIVDVYMGSKYSDTCINEIFFNNSYVPDYRKQSFTSIEDVYVDEENEHRLLIDSNASKGIEVLSSPENTLQLIDISADKRWVILISMPAFVGAGRVETEYLIFNTHLGRVMNEDIEKAIGAPLFGPFFILKNQENVIIEHSMGEVLIR